jgi:hypothetical protein
MLANPAHCSPGGCYGKTFSSAGIYAALIREVRRASSIMPRREQSTAKVLPGMNTSTLKHTARYAMRCNQVGVRHACSLISPTGTPDPSCYCPQAWLSVCSSIWHAARAGSFSALGFLLNLPWSSGCRACPSLFKLFLCTSPGHHAARQDATCRGRNGVGDLSGGILEIGPLWA